VSPDLSTTAVVIPALDEEDSLPHVLGAMPGVGAVFVVDNGSTDNTASVAASHGATVLSQPTRGYGLACQVGIEAAAAAGFDVVVIMDGDHSFEPTQMGRLVGPILADQADMVLGDRTKTAEPGSLTLPQRFGNKVATRMIHLVSGHEYRDMGPFRAIRTERLIALEMRDPNYGWNVEMQLKALKNGLRVLEVPVDCRSRVAGTSKISGSLRAAAKCGAKMMLATVRYAT
jgi:glycosyltransferase involved in cell wall biosynthesis